MSYWDRYLRVRSELTEEVVWFVCDRERYLPVR